MIRPLEFREYLIQKGVTGQALEEQMNMADDFHAFLSSKDTQEIAPDAGKEAVEQFTRQLIADGHNREEYFYTLIRYAHWIGHRSLYVALLELIDCSNAMEVLGEIIEEKHGSELRDRIFEEKLPPAGSSEKERWTHTDTVLRKMSSQMNLQERQAAWFNVQHGIPAQDWLEGDQEEKEKYQKCGGIEDYLALKLDERNQYLQKLHDENKLWYTVEITDEVLDFVLKEPEIESGRREGNKVYISKIPYNAKRYLQETDPKMKRYYACHCPLVREGILQGKSIPAEICNCSLGHASHYLAGLGVELRGEVLESAVNGDERCRFVFYLPE